MEVPELKIGHHETPSPYTLHGIKGGGEGGRMMAPAAINVAVNDALAPLGVRVTELPMTPDRLRAAIRAAQATGRVDERDDSPGRADGVLRPRGSGRG